MDKLKEIAEMERQLAELKAEQEAFDRLPEETKIEIRRKTYATELHTIECHQNHVDACEWDYDNGWNNVRLKYLKKIEVLEIITDPGTWIEAYKLQRSVR